MRSTILTIVVLLLLGPAVHAGTPAERLAKKPDAWFSTEAGRGAMDCILSWQSARGAWPKNTDTTSTRYTGDRSAISGTFDNGATTGELRVLARGYRVTREASYRESFLVGYDHILDAQYSNGGWPQNSSPGKGYHRHITFNDGCMIRLLNLLYDSTTADDFAFLDEQHRTAAIEAIHRGVDCILKCQVVVHDVPTVWCAQHDEQTLAPANARSYELASLSGAESAGVLRFLMRLEEPTPEVVDAVHRGVAWFDSARIDGFRYQRSRGKANLIPDPDAGPIWARFYEIETNRPFFCDRDGIPKYDLQEIGPERRGGYSWYGDWGEDVFAKYARWPHR